MPRAKTTRTPSSSSNKNKDVITMPQAVSAAPARTNGGSNPRDLEPQIRQRAYELYLERGRTPGQENEDWLRAEREVLARDSQQQSA